MKEDTPEAMTAETRKLAAMHLFSDEALWAATAPSFSPTEEYRLNQLNGTAGERDLTPAEDAEQQIEFRMKCSGLMDRSNGVTPPELSNSGQRYQLRLVHS